MMFPFLDCLLMLASTAAPSLFCFYVHLVGDAAWEYKAAVHPYGFSRNGRYYEPCTMYSDEFGNDAPSASAFTEDVTFLFRRVSVCSTCLTDGRGWRHHEVVHNQDPTRRQSKGHLPLTTTSFVLARHAAS